MSREYSGEYKARKGLIKVKFSLEGNIIKNMYITGDFILHPEETLWEIEKSLLEKPFDKNIIEKIIIETLERNKARFMGASPEDLVKAIIYAKEVEKK